MNPTSSSGATIPDAAARFQPYKTAFAFILFAAAIYAWWPHLTFAPSPAARPRPFVPIPFVADTEQAWMARMIGRDILEIIAYGTSGKDPSTLGLKFQAGTTFDGTKHTFTASFNGLTEKQTTVTVHDYFWSPDTYVDWTDALLKDSRPQSRPTAGPLNPDFIIALTNPTAETLIREDKRLSAGLTSDPLDPELHEQAALLVGSFAMRESAGFSFCDLRPYLCKITAHLAIAKAVRPQLGTSGLLAEAVLCSLSGRETPTRELMDRMQAGNGDVQIATTQWSRALRLRNTGDFRLLEQPENATLLERLEYVRALQASVGNAAAVEFVEEHNVERVPGWIEMLLTSDMTVGDGNRWAYPALAMELEAFAAHYRDYYGKQMTRSDVAFALNAGWERFEKTDATHCAFHVIGWGGWAHQHQRQLCGLIEAVSYWLGDMVGLPAEAKRFEDAATNQFRDLHLFPLILFYTKTDEATCQAYYNRVRQVAAQHREWITFAQWYNASTGSMRVNAPVRGQQQRQRQPSPTRLPKRRAADQAQIAKVNADPLFTMGNWFFPTLPVGTLYDLASRRERGMPFSNLGVSEAAKALAPNNRTVLWAHVMQANNFKPTPQQTEAELGPLTGYDVAAMKLVANAFQSDPKKYAEKYAAVCSVEPDRYVDLGDYLREHGDEVGAAGAYQNAFDHGKDRVHISNSMDWLVNYYYDHGRVDDAFKIANNAAEVYSQRGLVTLVNLLDRMGKIEEAEAYLKKTEQRYPDTTKDDLLEFYSRHSAKSPNYATAEQELRARAFPNGIEHVTLSDFKAAPADGAVLQIASARTGKAGLKAGDIIVSLNGYRIHDMKQYTAARHPNNNPNVNFIIWRGGQYTQLTCFFPRINDAARFGSYVATGH